MADESSASKLVPVARAAAIEAATLTLTHPISYVKTLIQLGHEPLGSYQARQWAFWKTAEYRPGALAYALHIRDQDGSWGLFRGLTPRLTSTFIYNYSKKFMDEQVVKIPELQCDEPVCKDSWDDGMKKVGTKIIRNSIAEAAAIIVSHPFQVLAIRSMAQFISREDAYESLIGGIIEIKDNNEGLSGFFKGIAPRLVGAIVAIGLAETLNFCLLKCIDSADEEVRQDNKDLIDSMTKYCSLFSSVITSSFTYPFTLCSTIMALSGSRLACATPLVCWHDCLSELKLAKEHTRGSSIFLGRKMPSVDMGKALAAAFWISGLADVTPKLKY